jgi:hypothetical protein
MRNTVNAVINSFGIYNYFIGQQGTTDTEKTYVMPCSTYPLTFSCRPEKKPFTLQQL